MPGNSTTGITMNLLFFSKKNSIIGEKGRVLLFLNIIARPGHVQQTSLYQSP